MHHVDQLLKQHEVVWVRAYARPDKDAIELFLPELALNHRLRSFLVEKWAVPTKFNDEVCDKVTEKTTFATAFN